MLVLHVAWSHSHAISTSLDPHRGNVRRSIVRPLAPDRYTEYGHRSFALSWVLTPRLSGWNYILQWSPVRRSRRRRWCPNVIRTPPRRMSALSGEQKTPKRD